MLFKREFLQSLADSEYDDHIVEEVEKELHDTSRWSIIYRQVFKMKDTGKFYVTIYKVGATECQDESPYEYAKDEIECQEVVPVEKTVIVYQPVT